MHGDLVDIGWTENQWNRITSVVLEEAQKARVAAQMLPVSGYGDPVAVAIPRFKLTPDTNPQPPPPKRLVVDSDPTLFQTTIAVNVPLHLREMADPELGAALVMFRRAANYVARLEDGLVFGGRTGVTLSYAGTIPAVFEVAGGGSPEGLILPGTGRPTVSVGQMAPVPAAGATPDVGNQLVNAIIEATNLLDANGLGGPYACALSPKFFAAICTPNANLVLPRDRVLPFLQGPLLRASVIPDSHGVVVSLSGSPIELLVTTDINVRYLQATLEPRYVFRVSEKVALRIKEDAAIVILNP
jgi:hypothetical protein